MFAHGIESEETRLTKDTSPRFIVAQRGARHGYAIPLLLAESGLLERFYTNATGNLGLGRWLAMGKRLPYIGQHLTRLANRRLPAEILDCTCSFASPDIKLALRSLFGRGGAAARFEWSVRHSRELGRLAVRMGFGRANFLFVMLSEFSPAIEAAKRQGLIVVSDVYTLASLERILADERQRFPDWVDDDTPNYESLIHKLGVGNVLFSHVDYYICPSQAVCEDLTNNWGISGSRVFLVPYGVSPEWLKLVPRPRKGRIIFVGSANLGKGIHYLAMASEKLRQRGRHYEFRIVGNVSDRVRGHPKSTNLTFLGRVPRDRVQEEFQAADALVLPTLAEGSAGVTYEALACGVPQIVTRAAGSVVRDGIEGRIINERDPIALADAIEEVVESRNLRDQMAIAARNRAIDYTWPRYRERLVYALTEIVMQQQIACQFGPSGFSSDEHSI